MSGVFERPVMPVYLSGKDRTCLVGHSAHRDHCFDRRRDKLVHRLRTMARDIDPDLPHGPDRQGMNVARRLRTGAMYLEQVTGRGAQQALRKVAATGVSRAKNQDGW